MNVLFLCNKSPYPPGEGGPLAMNANIKALLKAGHRVKVLALNTNKHFVDIESIPAEYREATGIEFVYVDLSIKPSDALINLFSSKSYHVERFISNAVKNRLAEILSTDTFDIVQLEMLHMTPYIDTIREHSTAKIVLRSHNIEHLIWKRITDSTKNPLKKAYLRLLTAKLRKYELDHLNAYDGIIAISEFDADYFRDQGCTVPLSSVPFGIETAEYARSEEAFEFPSLFHLGSMNWMPNEEGVRWFMEHTWPRIHKRFPNLKLYLAGRAMPDWLMHLNADQVEVLGEIDDAKSFIHSKAIMVVPLLSGSGIRIKIIEGMAMGKAIISTSIGAEGINYTDGSNILIADDPEAFLKAVERCTSDEAFCRELGSRAHELIAQEHSLEVVIKKLESFYKEVLEKN